MKFPGKFLDRLPSRSIEATLKYSSYEEFGDDVAETWGLLLALLDRIGPDLPEEQRAAPGQVSRPVDPGSKPSIDWTVREVLAHLLGWHLLLQHWLTATLEGETPSVPASGFNWRQTPALNRKIANEQGEYRFGSLKRKLRYSHRRILKLLSEFQPDELFKPGKFSWTGKSGLISYVAPNLAGHYRWAVRKIKSIRKKAESI